MTNHDKHDQHEEHEHTGENAPASENDDSSAHRDIDQEQPHVEQALLEDEAQSSASVHADHESAHAGHGGHGGLEGEGHGISHVGHEQISKSGFS